MKLRTRILLIIAAALGGMLIMGLIGLLQLRHSLLDERQQQITMLLQYSKAQLEYFHKMETDGRLSRSEAQQRAREAIGAQRKGDDYIFEVGRQP